MLIEGADHVLTKLRRAAEIHDALFNEVDDFLKSNPFSTYIEREDGWTYLRLAVNSEPPLRWSAMVGDAVHNLRSSLDVAVCQLVEHRTGRPSTPDHAFPMTKTQADYAARADSRTVGIHPKARGVIDDAKPYPGGNDDLYLLHTLDIEDKHHLLLALAAGADQGLKIGPSVGGHQQMHLMSRGLSKHLFPLAQGSTLLRTDVQDGAEDILSFHTFFPYIAMKPEGWELHEDVFVILDRLGQTAEEVARGLIAVFDL